MEYVRRSIFYFEDNNSAWLKDVGVKIRIFLFAWGENELPLSSATLTVENPGKESLEGPTRS